jgi:hypothetical protein
MLVPFYFKKILDPHAIFVQNVLRLPAEKFPV